jgi:hypothetical protein
MKLVVLSAAAALFLGGPAANLSAQEINGLFRRLAPIKDSTGAER